MMADPAAMTSLSDLRALIDAIDDQLHSLLMQRATVIDALIEAKGTNGGKVAFRPQREAEMMRRLAERHHGTLPLATVEHLWREIITTFTYLQAPFRLVVDAGRAPAAMHDLARFAFGFSVDLVQADTPDAVIATVAETRSDLGLIPVGTPAASRWWRSLSMANGHRVMALWPFIAKTDPVTDISALVISPPLDEATPPDLAVLAATDDRPSGTPITGVSIISEYAIEGGRDILLATPRGSQSGLTGEGLTDIAEVGGIAVGLAASPTDTILRAPLPRTP
jgi:chorismate mutase-like protein